MSTVVGSAGTTPIGMGRCGGLRPKNCDFDVTPLSSTMAASGGEFSAKVSEPRRECTWAAESRVPWIIQRTPAPGAEECGNPPAPARFEVQPNTSTASRVGVLRIAGRDVTITQAGAAPSCQYRLNGSRDVTIPASGGSGSVSWTLVSGTNCTWTAQVPKDFYWITVSTSSGTGDITVRFLVAPNQGAQRSGHIEVRWPGPQRGENIVITQQAPAGRGGQKAATPAQ